MYILKQVKSFTDFTFYISTDFEKIFNKSNTSTFAQNFNDFNNNF